MKCPYHLTWEEKEKAPYLLIPHISMQIISREFSIEFFCSLLTEWPARTEKNNWGADFTSQIVLKGRYWPKSELGPFQQHSNVKKYLIAAVSPLRNCSTSIYWAFPMFQAQCKGLRVWMCVGTMMISDGFRTPSCQHSINRTEGEGERASHVRSFLKGYKSKVRNWICQMELSGQGLGLKLEEEAS